MQRFYGRFLDGAPAAGLLVLRFFVGMGMMAHGWGKIQKPFAWMGSDGVHGGLQALAALSEFGGGLAILLGFLTPLGAAGVLATMIGAWYFAHFNDPWLRYNSKGPSFELAALYGSLALTLILTGPGRFSLDALLFGKNKK